MFQRGNCTSMQFSEIKCFFFNWIGTLRVVGYAIHPLQALLGGGNGDTWSMSVGSKAYNLKIFIFQTNNSTCTKGVT